MHLICKMFYFCFHGNHSHNLRLKVYLVVSLVISDVKNRKYILEKYKSFCIVFATKPKVWDKNTFFQEI